MGLVPVCRLVKKKPDRCGAITRPAMRRFHVICICSADHKEEWQPTYVQQNIGGSRLLYMMRTMHRTIETALLSPYCTHNWDNDLFLTCVYLYVIAM